MKKKIILASLVVLGSIELSAYTYEVSPLIGKNFTESSSLVNDSTAYGIRINKYITDDNAIMFGYTRINNADYKRSSLSDKSTRTGGDCEIDPCADKIVIDECKRNSDSCHHGKGKGHSIGSDGDTSSDSDGDTSSDSDGDTSSDSDGDTSSGEDKLIPTPGTGINSLGSGTGSDTDINRFYINGLHNIQTKYSRLVPYVYGGFGYEHIENELADNDSQGFFNAGGGLKFRVNDRFNLISDIQGIKKFKSHDLDILGSLGVGYLFGSLIQSAPEALAVSGLEDIQPAQSIQPTAPQREITVIKVAPQALSVAPVMLAPTGEYYVQMAAGFKTDMETGCKHTQDLRDAGIDYDIKYRTVGGKNAALVVVGPFETNEEATSQLSTLRQYSKDAFVKRIRD